MNGLIIAIFVTRKVYNVYIKKLYIQHLCIKIKDVIFMYDHKTTN